jgi:hypothetical protein
VKGYSFSIYADLCSSFRQKSRKTESSGFQRVTIPLLPRSPAASQQFSYIYLFALFRGFPRLA